jgi:hypothetical protein
MDKTRFVVLTLQWATPSGDVSVTWAGNIVDTEGGTEQTIFLCAVEEVIKHSASYISSGKITTPRNYSVMTYYCR